METESEQRADLSGLTILVVDDEPSIVRSLERFLSGLGANVQGVCGLREARLSFSDAVPDLVLADLKLKDGEGLDLIPDFQTRNPDGLFYLITGHGSVANAASAFKQGVRDYFEKPVDPFLLAKRLEADFAGKGAKQALTLSLAPYLVFRDPFMAEALADLPRFAGSSEPVLIQGETGTGKELVARALHGIGRRAQGPFVAVNCGAIPETMLEAELFGYEKGAFTGANRMHRGRFEQADKGTLFLDEIGEMPATAQVSLLRVLEDGALQRIGGEQTVSIDVRVVAATHRALEERTASGLFRQDLLFRLNVLPLTLPPLRKRPADIALLARQFLAHSLNDMEWKDPVPGFSNDGLDLLNAYSWPGNVREVRNMMTRLAVRLPAGLREIGPRLLRPLLPDERHRPQGGEEGVFIPAGTSLEDAEWLLIDAALKQSGYNRTQAAKILGIGERTLRRKLNQA